MVHNVFVNILDDCCLLYNNFKVLYSGSAKTMEYFSELHMVLVTPLTLKRNLKL